MGPSSGTPGASQQEVLGQPPSTFGGDSALFSILGNSMGGLCCSFRCLSMRLLLQGSWRGRHPSGPKGRQFIVHLLYAGSETMEEAELGFSPQPLTPSGRLCLLQARFGQSVYTRVCRAIES